MNEENLLKEVNTMASVLQGLLENQLSVVGQIQNQIVITNELQQKILKKTYKKTKNKKND